MQEEIEENKKIKVLIGTDNSGSITYLSKLEIIKILLEKENISSIEFTLKKTNPEN